MSLKALIFACTVILVCLLVSVHAAQTAPPDTHFVTRCIKITNIEQFSSYTFLGYVHKADGTHEIYRIQPNTCMTTGSAENTLTMFAVQTIDLQGENYDDALEHPNFNTEIPENPTGNYYGNTDATVHEEIEYAIAGLKDSLIYYYTTQVTTTYNNGSPLSTVTYTNPFEGKSWEAEEPDTNTETPASSTTTPGSPDATQPTSTETPATTQTTSTDRNIFQAIICFFQGLFGHPCPA